MKINPLLAFFFLTFSFVHSQSSLPNNDEKKIAAVLENYFNLEREAIHLHLNKSVFLTNESIWLKGYILNRKDSKPLFTTNVYLLLLDENGKQVSEQLVYASNGVFSGKIELKPLPSGYYYIQAYTNWMNNFSEDESTISRITVINPHEGIKNYKKLNPNSLKVNINPEGGNYVKGIENSVGISLLDCRNNTIDSIEGKLQTIEGETLRTFKLNQFGYGKINVPSIHKKLKISFNYNNESFEKELPMPVEFGLGLMVNNASDGNKTFINLNTNPETLQALGSKKLFLVISKDQKAIIQEFSFKNQAKKSFIIEKKNFFDGINTIRIIDEDLNLLCERLLYSETSQRTVSLSPKVAKKNQINIVGFSNTDSSISISSLPGQTKANDYNKTSINVGLNINPYLIQPLEHSSYYFKDTNRIKRFELDLALVNQATMKYNWNNMKNNVPKSNYSFDIGLNLEGTIDKNIKDKTHYKVKLLSYLDFVNKISDVNETGQYSLQNFVIADSSYMDLSLLKLPDFKKIDAKLKPTVHNRNRPFYKPFRGHPESNCGNFEYENLTEEFPKLAPGVVPLEEVIVENKTLRPKLTYANDFGNINLRGFKIDESYASQTLLNFISSQGFAVTRYQGQVSISNKITTTLMGGQSVPEITINGRRLFSFDELDYTQMSEIDEIFLNRHEMISGMFNRQGVIKIYTKKTLSRILKDESFQFFIAKGFSRTVKYESEKYSNFSGKGFENYGVIGWSPDIISDENGRFDFEIPDTDTDKILINIEGISNDGGIIQQELPIGLK